MKRNAPLDLIDDEEELDSFPHWIKKFVSSYHLIDTTYYSISEISVDVFNIIHAVSFRIPY
ncbi:MAG: hypothetical protein EU530_01470 [Promethearchaeota archaeon]|nr:MAG: hypothetical protein EU530_01470 [Candidatus Lokiarchaeota archaeon]